MYTQIRLFHSIILIFSKGKNSKTGAGFPNTLDCLVEKPNLAGLKQGGDSNFGPRCWDLWNGPFNFPDLGCRVLAGRFTCLSRGRPGTTVFFKGLGRGPSSFGPTKVVLTFFAGSATPVALKHLAAIGPCRRIGSPTLGPLHRKTNFLLWTGLTIPSVGRALVGPGAEISDSGLLGAGPEPQHWIGLFLFRGGGSTFFPTTARA